MAEFVKDVYIWNRNQYFQLKLLKKLKHRLITNTFRLFVISLYLKRFQQFQLETLYFLTQHMHIFNKIHHYCTPLIDIFLRMAT